ncbi:phosphoglycerate dehydrogenase [Pseudogemmobacter hezensis]|uniref:phosphoglycerate dehydrogenase n=1 Tax=Pseudogemmobacter hezensis TaxID=2737662 RepID=UPI001C12EA39|nr:phosphoglycerate dehydrogenase [Pseudogemmobacter hezensis]
MKNVLVTCPPMLGQIDLFMDYAAERGLKLHPAKVTQILSEEELKALLPDYDGWIIGDDPATRDVFETAQKGKLRAAVKWGIGVDNVDFAACKDLGIPIINTPQMFGTEVADVAVAFVIGLARQLFLIDRGVREGKWLKPAGISLSGRRAGVIGLGDIGRNAVTRLQALGLNVTAYDPGVAGDAGIPGLARATWPEGVEELDFLVFTCSLNQHNFHMLNAEVLARCKPGVRVVNVARGPLIDEAALIAALQSGHVHSAALDVFEVEPLPADSPLRGMERAILGTHNGSNTIDGVIRASHTAINHLSGFLGAKA